jgi:hypothetical protein
MKFGPREKCRTVVGVYFPDTLANVVPKVPEVPSPPLWHFWHPLTLGISKGTPLGKSAERRAIKYKRSFGWKPSKA